MLTSEGTEDSIGPRHHPPDRLDHQVSKFADARQQRVTPLHAKAGQGLASNHLVGLQEQVLRAIGNGLRGGVVSVEGAGLIVIE